MHEDSEEVQCASGVGHGRFRSCKVRAMSSSVTSTATSPHRVEAKPRQKAAKLASDRLTLATSS
eukprot:5494606-Karenia_brevis.AAC.1